MDASNPITAPLFSAFLKCQTKAHLLAIGEAAAGAFFAHLEARISSMYKAVAKQRLRVGVGVTRPLHFEDLRGNLGCETAIYHVDCETAVYDVALPPYTPGRQRPQHLSQPSIFVPVLFSPWDKAELSDSLLLAFGALALSQVTGTLPGTGTLICGDGHRHKTVKIGDHIAEARQIINTIGTIWHGRERPPLVLNRHCAVCDFQPRCHSLATEHDDLSLLAAMNGKERAKLKAKGITTITHLSYGYRPRRRKRNRPDTESSRESPKLAALAAKNDHKLKALAIKKSQIHVVGTPSLKFDGTPVFLDVEGMPDRDFYYLAGLRFERDGEHVERSFWADEPGDERIMWENCLSTLKAIGNAQIISYGAYETRFLRKMKDRYTLAPDDAALVDNLINTLVNLLACIYGKIYFPTFSNSLKEVGRYLGFEWTWPQASGAAAPLLRRAWELRADDELKCDLIDYNMDDCRAAATIADALMRICRGGALDLNAVDVTSLEVSFRHTFGKFNSAFPEFAKINDAAYWDYQRSKVYVRTDKTIQKLAKKHQYERKTILVDRDAATGEPPKICHKCKSENLLKVQENSYIVRDLKFTRNGIKRWVIRYRYSRYRCSECHAERSNYSGRSYYGQNLRAFVVYLIIELRLSENMVANHVSLLFNLPLTSNNAHHIKETEAQKYEPTYGSILHEIVKGAVVHVDETRGAVKGRGHYMWVFANLTTVAYVYAPSRDSVILEEILNGFNGVLVSDFYAAYDSIPCAQQKCLIHLMRDINEDLHKHPFDEELKDIARQFGALLREIVETIDARGLKTRYLSKHKRAAAGFIDHVIAKKCTTEAALALQKRISKNRDKLFTFLSYDGVPWNNNNAEHAVHIFAFIRNGITISTPKGHREYAILLSIYQTLKYRGMDFLEFLRSGRTEINKCPLRTDNSVADQLPIKPASESLKINQISG